MATLNLEIKSTRAEQAAAAFKRILNDIQQAVQRLDLSTPTDKLTADITRIIKLMQTFTQAVGRGVSAIIVFGNTVNNVFSQNFVVQEQKIKSLAMAINSLANAIKKLQSDAVGFQSFASQMAGLTSSINSLSESSIANLRALSSRVGSLSREFSQLHSQTGKAKPASRGMSEQGIVTPILRVPSAVDPRSNIAQIIQQLEKFNTESLKSTLQAQSRGVKVPTLFVDLKSDIAQTMQQLEKFNIEFLKSTLQAQSRGVKVPMLFVDLKSNISQTIEELRKFNAELSKTASQSHPIRSLLSASQQQMGSIIQITKREREMLEAVYQAARRRQGEGPEVPILVGGQPAIRVTKRDREMLEAVYQAARRRQGEGPEVPTLRGGPTMAPEIQQSLFALEMFKNAVRKAKSEKDRLDANLRETSEFTLPNFYRGLRLVSTFLAGFTFYRLTQELSRFTEELLDTGRQLQHNRALFLAAAGGVFEQSRHLQSLARNLSQAFGAPLLQTETAFARLAGAARGTNIEGEKLEETARGIIAAVAVLGSGTDKATNIIKVFTDILGKGRVQSEEVVKQFGNAVPGAFRLVAESLGKTTAGLTQDIQRGTLRVTEVIPAVAAQLGRIYESVARANVNTLVGSFNILRNSILLLKEAVLVGGAELGFIDFFKSLTQTLTSPAVTQAAKELGYVLGTFLRNALVALNIIIQVTARYWEVFASIITGGALVAGLLGLIGTLGLLAIAFKSAAAALTSFLTTVGVAITVTAPLLALFAGVGGAIVALVTYFLLFRNSSSAVAKALEEHTARQREWAQATALGASNFEDESRAMVQAGEAIAKEIRTFEEDVRQQVELLGLVGRGVKVLSFEFDTYGRTLNRIRALERRGIFEGLADESGAVRASVQQQLRALEERADILEQIINLQRNLNQLQQDERGSRFLLDIARSFGRGLTQQAMAIQEDIIGHVIPVLERAQDIARRLFVEDPQIAANFVNIFNQWADSLRDVVVNLRYARDELKELTSLAEQFRELQLANIRISLLAQVRGGTRLERAAPAQQVVAEAISAFGISGIPFQVPRLSGGGGVADIQRFAESLGKDIGDIVRESGAPVHTFQGSVMEFGTHVKEFGKHVSTAGKSPQLITSGVPEVVSRATTQFADIINRVGEQIGIDPELIRRLIQRESGFNPLARGSRGEVGLTQILPSTAAGFPEFRGLSPEHIVERLKDPATNIYLGVRYLADQIRAFGGDIRLGLAAYNVGQAGARQGRGLEYAEAILSGYTGPGILPGFDIPRRDRTYRGPGLFSRQTLNFLSRLLFGGPGVVTEIPPSGISPTPPTLPPTGRFVTDEEMRQAEILEENRQRRILEAQRTIGITGSRIGEDLFRIIQSAAPVEERFLTPEQDIERRIKIYEALQKRIEQLGLTEEDVASKSERFQRARVELDAIALLVSERYFAERREAGETFIRGLQLENESIQQQIELLKVPVALRDIEANSVRRLTEAKRVGAFVTAESAKRVEEENAALREQQNILRSREFTTDYIERLQISNQELRDQIGLLSLEAEKRDIAASALRRYREIERQHLLPEDRAMVLEQIREEIRLQEMLLRLQGPIQRAVDSFKSLRDAVEDLAVSMVRSFGDALTETIVGFGQRLAERNRDVIAAQADLERARVRLRTAGVDPGARSSALEEVALAERAVQRAREERPSVIEALLQPLGSLLEKFSQDIIRTLIEQFIEKNILKLLSDVKETIPPEVLAIQQQTGALTTSIATLDASTTTGLATLDASVTAGLTTLGATFTSDILAASSSITGAIASSTGAIVSAITSSSISGTSDGSFFGGLLSSLSNFGGLQAGLDSGTAASLVSQGFDPSLFAAGLVHGGIVGVDRFHPIRISERVFDNVRGYQFGGIVGAGTDTVPALLTPGEGVFTEAQMKRLAPVSERGNTYIFYISMPNVTDSSSLRRTSDQIFAEIANRIQRSALRDGVRKQRS